MMKVFVLCFLMVSSWKSFADEQLMVGLMGFDMKPKIGIPLAGYGSKDRRLKEGVDWRFRYPESTFFKPSEGIHSPIRSKVMVLKKGTQKLIFISLDTIGVEDRLIKAVMKRVRRYGIREKDLIISATHTHGGPGTLSTRIPLQAVAVDVYRHKNFLYFTDRVVKSIEAALENLRPATLYKSKAEITGVQRNKWHRSHFDNRASFLLAKDAISGEWLGGLVNFSIHGGTMPIPVMLYSSDVNGAIEKELENHLAHKNYVSTTAPYILFMNGAEGDVGGNAEREVENVTLLAQEFMRDAAPALEENKMTEVAPTISSSKKKIFVGIPILRLKGCQDGLLNKMPAWVKPSLYPLLPLHSYISKAKVGDITFLTWPGEPSTQLGWDLQALAAAKGEGDPLVIGLANDYMAYFTTKTEFAEKQYDSCSTIYGWKGGGRILKAHKKWL